MAHDLFLGLTKVELEAEREETLSRESVGNLRSDEADDS